MRIIGARRGGSSCAPVIQWPFAKPTGWQSSHVMLETLAFEARKLEARKPAIGGGGGGGGGGGQLAALLIANWYWVIRLGGSAN